MDNHQHRTTKDRPLHKGAFTTIEANLSKPHREVIEGLISKYFQDGEQGLLETLTAYLQDIRKYYKEQKR